MEHLPTLCEAMHRGELYTCKDDSFRLRSCKTHNNARMYRDRNCVSSKLTDLRYMMNILHMVQAQQAQYILAQTDVTAFAIAALGSIEFVEPPHTTAGLIPYGQLFDEHKVQLKLNRCWVHTLTYLIASLVPYDKLFSRTHITSLILNM